MRIKCQTLRGMHVVEAYYLTSFAIALMASHKLTATPPRASMVNEYTYFMWVGHDGT